MNLESASAPFGPAHRQKEVVKYGSENLHGLLIHSHSLHECVRVNVKYNIATRMQNKKGTKKKIVYTTISTPAAKLLSKRNKSKRVLKSVQLTSANCVIES